MVFVPVIGRTDAFDELIELYDGPFVQFDHIIEGDRSVGVKSIKIAQNKPRCIANLEIDVGQLLENVLRDANIGPVIGGRHPKP